MKITNALTILRFFLIFVIAAMLYSTGPNIILASILVFIFAMWTDWADGWIARRFNKQTVFGTFFDPLVDKILILSIFFIFVDLKIIPLWMILVVMFREFLVTGVRQVASKPKKIVGANWMGKTKFMIQSLNIIYLQAVLYFISTGTESTLFTITGAYYFTLLMTIISLAFAFNFVYWHRTEVLEGI